MHDLWKVFTFTQLCQDILVHTPLLWYAKYNVFFVYLSIYLILLLTSFFFFFLGGGGMGLAHDIIDIMGEIYSHIS